MRNPKVARGIGMDQRKHFAFVTAGFHIRDRFHVCNRLTTFILLYSSNVKTSVINVKNSTNANRITVIVCDLTVG